MSRFTGEGQSTVRLRDWIHRLDDPVDLRSPATDGSTKDGSAEDGGTQDGSTEDGSTKDRRQADEVAELRRRLAESERQRERLETSQQLLETALETMSMGVTITDLEGKIIYANPADASMHGYRAEELVGRRAAGVYAAVGSETGEPLASEGLWSRRRLDTAKDGRIFPVRLISDRILDQAQQPLGTITLCEDLGEQQRFKEALARRDGVLEALAVAAEKLLVDSSWEGVEKVLERLGRATGVDLIYILRVKEARPFQDLQPSSVILGWGTPAGNAETAFSEGLGIPDREELFERWHERLQGGEILHGPVKALPVEEQELLVPWGVGAYVVVPIFVRDELRGYLCLEDGDDSRLWSVTELEALRTASRTFAASIQRNDSDRALADSEARYRDVLENANDLIQSVSPDGRFRFVNRAWKDALGYSDDEIDLLRVWDVARGGRADEDRDVVQSILTDDGRGRFEAVFMTKDGSEIPVEGSVNCRYEDGLPVATRGIFRDITERKVYDRMTQEFISTVSHELRTPLTSIIASLGLLESGRLQKPERIQELVSIALRNGNRLLQLINNLLDLQKLTANKLSFRLEELELRPFLVEAIEGIRAFADSYEVTLSMAEIEDDILFFGDFDRLIQVFDNLLSNAIKFSPIKETVWIETKIEEQHVVITVRDSGPGIPEEFRSRLFDRFTQFDSSAARRSGGSGLGLSIVKGLVEGMNGAIHLETEVGKGTAFRIELPRFEVPEEPRIDAS